MAQVSVAQTIHAEQIGAHSGSAKKGEGTLKAGGKEYSVAPFSDTESVTEGVFKYLQDANSKQLPPEALAEHQFFSEETLANLSQEMGELEQMLEQQGGFALRDQAPKEEAAFSRMQTPSPFPKGKEPQQPTKPYVPSPNTSQGMNLPKTSRPEVFSSLFSLARSLNTATSEASKAKRAEQLKQLREETQAKASTSETSPIERPNQTEEGRLQRDREGKQDQQDRQEQQEEQDQKEGFAQDPHAQKEKKKKKESGVLTQAVGKVSASRSSPNVSTSTGSSPSQQTQGKSSAQVYLGGVENVYLRFMALMARILGQAEREAHELYLKIKERTDSVDVLTLLVSKINNEKGPIDWTNNEEMKKLIEKARQIGVDIPADKLKWSEEEKKLLKENIQMRKDSLEKVTQLERTDMQRYLQEASQCHQARSNVLKLLKEVVDTFVHNMRPN